MRMYLPFVLMILLLVAGCAEQRPVEPQPDFKMTATVKDLMDSIVDPSADFIWEAVQTIVSVNGIEERMPRTDEEWKEVRKHAIMLLEAANMLQLPGRAVARPGEKAEDPKVELEPEQIEEMIKKDRATWNTYAQALHEATLASFKAIEAKDAQGLLNTSDAIDAACEKCHLHYWYPGDNPAEGASQKSDK